MHDATLLWHRYRYFSYERALAHREAKSLISSDIEVSDEGLKTRISAQAQKATRRLTYFKAVEQRGENFVPDQAKLEASAGTNGSTWCPQSQPVPALRRQSTRYSAHGLHEYRGKFNPQIVRAIGNIFGLTEGDWLLDPFCGSGTTLLESAHIGWNCIGTEINPLGVEIANAKVTAFRTPPKTLEDETGKLTEKIAKQRDSESEVPNREYVEAWFSPEVLKQLRDILGAIRSTPGELQPVYRVILSDICREVSLQDPSDLRIRRRKDAKDNYPVKELFLEAVEAKIGTILRARKFVSAKDDSVQLAVECDTRNSTAPLREFLLTKDKRKFDAALTSPPYVTALPYMDTQRLSLTLLGLIEAKQLRVRERDLIGNREISDRDRSMLEEQLKKNSAKLPKLVHEFSKYLAGMADAPEHGFRRRNVPALTYKYFVDMKQMFLSVAEIVKSSGFFGLLVGHNTTTLKGVEIQIDTPHLLATLAQTCGWKLKEMLPFDAYQRYDMHQGNSITSENLIVLQRC